MTSQGALYALMTRRYMELFGLTEAELGLVSVGQRAFAAMNPRAIMRKPITLQDYLDAEYISEPLRLYDYCLINDGGVALILTTRDRARSLRQPVVAIAGIGRADENVGATSLEPRLMTFYHRGHELAREQLYAMAGAGPEDIDSLQVYDSFSCHIIYALVRARGIRLLRSGRGREVPPRAGGRPRVSTARKHFGRPPVGNIHAGLESPGGGGSPGPRRDRRAPGPELPPRPVRLRRRWQDRVADLQEGGLMAAVRPEPRRNVYEEPFWDLVDQYRLSDLDAVVGDGDFGYSMARGFEKVRQLRSFGGCVRLETFGRESVWTRLALRRLAPDLKSTTTRDTGER